VTPYEGFDDSIKILENGLNLFNAIGGLDENNHETVTMSYELVPADTTHTEISIETRWKSGQDQGNIVSSNYVSASIDCEKKTITITKLLDFSYVVEVVLRDVLAPNSVMATIEVHLEEKFRGWSPAATQSFPSGKPTNPHEGEGSEGVWPNVSSDEIIQLRTEGFSSTFTDPISHEVTGFGNVVVGTPGFRYISVSTSTGTPYVYDFPSAVQSDLWAAISRDFEAMFSATSFKVDASLADYEDLEFILDQNERYMAVETLQALHGYEDGIIIDIPLIFDATVAGVNAVGVKMYHSIKVPYSVYEEMSDRPLTSISVEETTVTF